MKIDVKNNPDVGSIKGDSNQLEQVIMNLMTNGVDAMPDGGTLTVEYGNITHNNVFSGQFMDCAAGEYVYLRVKDTGTGMSKEDVKKIFEPFYTTKKSVKSTGLGLAVVYGIVKQNGYFINFESKINEGTTVEVLFPRVYEIIDILSIPPEPSQMTNPGTILLVEDEPIVLKSTSRMLKRHNYNVLEAASGEEALKIMENFSGDIDLLLTDVIMTGMSGKDLADKIKTDNPSMKIIFMSGYTRDTITSEGIIGQRCYLFIQAIYHFRTYG